MKMRTISPNADLEYSKTRILELEIKRTLSTKTGTDFERDLLSEMLIICEKYRAHLKGGLPD
jgi:hypothetical protein